MKTSLVYSISKEEKMNFNTGKFENHIKSRGFEFYVSGAKTKEEHEKTIDSFHNFLLDNGIQSDGFGSGTWEEALRYGIDGQKDFSFLSIVIDSIDEKETIQGLYKEWEKINKGIK